MFSSIKNFVSRHKRKIVVTSAVFGGLYLLSGYVQRRLRQWQEKEAKKFFEMTRKKQHFESTERTCNQTLMTMSKILTESILSLLKTEQIVKELQEKKLDPEEKLELWESLKVMIFTRICALVYALSILQVMLRVQLNIIGGYLYRDTMREDTPFINNELQAKYLSLCHHFVSNGVTELVKHIEDTVRQVVKPVSLKKKITLREVEQMFWTIRTNLSTDFATGDPIKKLVHYLVNHSPANHDAVIETLVKETMDILESDEVISITTASVSRCFSLVVDEIANLFVAKSVPNTKNQLEVDDHVVTEGALKLTGGIDTFVDINKVEIHFVMLLPVINELITKNNCKGDTNMPDLLTQQLTLNDKFKLLGANIYEAFSSA